MQTIYVVDGKWFKDKEVAAAYEAKAQIEKEAKQEIETNFTPLEEIINYIFDEYKNIFDIDTIRDIMENQIMTMIDRRWSELDEESWED